VLGDPEDVDDLLTHEGGAGDHAVRAVADPALDAVDVGLGVLVDPALMAAMLGRVDGRDERRVEAAGEVVARVGDQPVVPVDEVEVEAIAKLNTGGQHVRVHPLHPGHELVQLGRAGRLPDPVHPDPGHRLLVRRLLPTPGEHVDLGVPLDERLRQLPHVASQPALDQRRVLPGENQDPIHRLSPPSPL
jgi:hypothetical protein